LNATQIIEFVVQVLLSRLPSGTLSRTTYAVCVVTTTDGTPVVIVSEAGAGASGISGPLLEHISERLRLQTDANFAVMGCAAPTPGQGQWHMNDAEIQIINTLQQASSDGGALANANVLAIGATRVFCESCTFRLRSIGLQINEARTLATRPV